MITKGMLTSNKDDWETPQDLFDKLNERYGFTLDACASPENAKCEKYYTKEQNSLVQDWNHDRVWCNPPYGKEIAKFVRKAALSTSLVVMLLPARTDTKYFHEYIYGKQTIYFLKGRLKFSNSKTPAPFPSMIVVFRDYLKKGTK